MESAKILRGASTAEVQNYIYVVLAQSLLIKTNSLVSKRTYTL